MDSANKMLQTVYKQQRFTFHSFTDQEVKTKTQADLMSGEGLFDVLDMMFSVSLHCKRDKS